MKVASMDIGTNSVRLYVGERQGAQLVRLRQEMRITRIGQGVDRAGQLHPEAVDRTIVALKEYRRILDEYDVEKVCLVATSAVRDAKNREAFRQTVDEQVGLELRILSGDEEARMSFVGALAALPLSDRPQHALVVDIGGGSTELFFGTHDSLAGGVSLQMGSVRMTERYIREHPITEHQWLDLLAGIRKGLRPVQLLDVPQEAVLIAVGGTATTAAALHLGLAEYDPGRVTGLIMEAADIQRMVRHLAAMDLRERLRLPGMSRGREDVVVAGLAILEQVMEGRELAQVMVSDGDLLQGIFLTD